MLKCCPERDYALRVSVFFGLIRPDGNCFAKAVDAACLDDLEIHFRPPVFSYCRMYRDSCQILRVFASNRAAILRIH